MPRKRSRRTVVAWLAVLALLGSGCAAEMGALAPRGSDAESVADLTWYMIWVSLVVFLGWGALFAAAMFRRRRPSYDENQLQRLDRRFVIGGGIILPGIVFASLLGLNFGTLLALPDGNQVTVDVVGKQYWWEFAYAEPGFVTANEMHIPTDTDVLVRLYGEDVIHSFWVPQLGGKHDMIPGRQNEFTIRADEPGTYFGECTEYCGIQHAKMRFTVVAESPENYQAWLDNMAAPAAMPDTPEEIAGYNAFFTNSCAGCHAMRGTPANGQLGPELTHFAQRDTIGAGAVPNNRGNLGGWVVNAQTIKKGSRMPPIEVNAQELPALLTYLESLR